MHYKLVSADDPAVSLECSSNNPVEIANTITRHLAGNGNVVPIDFIFKIEDREKPREVLLGNRVDEKFQLSHKYLLTPLV